MKKFRESALVKSLVYAFTGLVTYPGLNIVNRIQMSGMEHLADLPGENVLFVCNHQTYFADVIALIHIFCARRFGRKHSLGFPVYLLWPATNLKYVAAGQTMKSNLLTKFFILAGAITVKRTWNKKAKEDRAGLEVSDTRNIMDALRQNWVITFPQGTTEPFAPGRNGTALIIRQTQPIVIPVVIDGFSSAFDKKGLKIIKKGVALSIRFKAPLKIDPAGNNDQITEQLMEAIEQSARFAALKIR